jgi:hypothetical protein
LESVNKNQSRPTTTGISYSNIPITSIGNTRISQSFYYGGNLGLVLYYNRALTDNEIIQTYNAYQNRFNLPGDIVTNGLVLNLDTAYYNSYPRSGTTWSDLSGSGNNGTLTNGVTFNVSGASSSMQFDGVDDYVSQTYTKLSNGLTLNAWMRTTSTRSVKSYLGDASNNIIGDTTNNVWIGFGVTNGKLNYNNAKKTGEWSTSQYNSTASVNDGNWKYLTVTHDKTNELVSLYINGALDSTFNNTSSGGFDQWGSTAFNVISKGYVNDNFNGDISNVQIYNRALSAPEVSQNFNALRGRFGI